MSEDDDVKDVLRADLSGVHWLRKDREAQDKIQRCRKALHICIKTRDKRGFFEAIRDAGIKDGTPEFRKMADL